jgi:hypothetical protein
MALESYMTLPLDSKKREITNCLASKVNLHKIRQTMKMKSSLGLLSNFRIFRISAKVPRKLHPKEEIKDENKKEIINPKTFKEFLKPFLGETIIGL